MIKNYSLATILLLIGFATKVWAYDFSAKCESGQTLFYNITSATQPYTVEVTSGEAPIGDLVIPSTVSDKGKKYSVTSIGASAFYMCKELKSLIIPSSVTSIGDSAFYRCEGLTSVKIPKSVTSIGNGAFGLCDNFTDIIFESDITLSDADLYFVKKGIKYSVQDKKSVKIMPHFIIYMGEIRVPDPNSEDPDWPDYVSVEAELEDCLCPEDSIVIIPETIKAGNTFTVTSIGNGGFGDGWCFHVKSITIPNSVTSIGRNAFSCCENLATITIPNSVTSIGDSAFYGCRSLKSVYIHRSVTSIGKHAFYGCDSITNITFESDITLSDADLCMIKDEIRYAVVDKKSVKLVPNIVEEQIRIIDPYSDDYDNPDYLTINVTTNKCPSRFATITIPETITFGDNTFTVTSIVDSAFQGCGNIESVTVPSSVTSIGFGAFYGCSELISVTIPKSVQSIGYAAFGDCNNLDSKTVKKILKINANALKLE